VSTRERGAWLGQAGVNPPGRGGGQGFGRRPRFLFSSFCINLHVISDIPLLTGMKHSLQFARTY